MMRYCGPERRWMSEWYQFNCLLDEYFKPILIFLFLKCFASSKICKTSSGDKSKLDRKLLLASLFGFSINSSRHI